MNKQKTGGRQKGTPNKVTASTRDFLNHLIDDNQELIYENFRKLEPYQMMTILAKILPYITPKLASKTEKDEHDIALQQVQAYLQLGQMLNQWNEKTTAETEEPTTTSNNPTAEVSDASCPAKASDQESSLNSSTLDNSAQQFSVSGASGAALSEVQKPSTKKPTYRPLKQQQHQPFYAVIANKRRR